jgi:hypothetical protein
MRSPRSGSKPKKGLAAPLHNFLPPEFFKICFLSAVGRPAHSRHSIETDFRERCIWIVRNAVIKAAGTEIPAPERAKAIWMNTGTEKTGPV